MSSTSSTTATKKAIKYDDDRIRLTKTHRQVTMQVVSNQVDKKIKYRSYMTVNPLQDVDGRTDTIGELKEILIKDMVPDLDKIYENRILVLTLIEQPMFGFTPINLLAEDAKKRAIRVSVHEVTHDLKAARRFAFGTKLAIIDPYHRIALDGGNGIRVDDPNKIIALGAKVNMCRYCGVENAVFKCSKCKVSYCSRECQSADWKVMKHKVVCEYLRLCQLSQ